MIDTLCFVSFLSSTLVRTDGVLSLVKRLMSASGASVVPGLMQFILMWTTYNS